MKNFLDRNDEKISEKAFSQSMLVSVLSILLCIVALCSVTYAWFTNETASSNNKLTSGSFDVTIAVSKVEDGVATASNIDVQPDPANVGKYYCTLEPVAGAETTYEISLKLTDTSTVKGHCIVKIGAAQEQHTAAIIGTNTANVVNEPVTDPFTFRITVKETTKVILEPRWGVVVNPDIMKDATIVVEPVSSAPDDNDTSVEP